MKLDDRVAELAKNVAIEDLIRGRGVPEAAAILGESPASTYRRIASGEIGHIKLEGRTRKGRGRAGAVRIRLIDIIEFQVRNERAAGETAALRGNDEHPQFKSSAPRAQG